MKHGSFLQLFFLCATVFNTSAKSQPTTESRVAGRIAAVLDEAATTSQGNTPTNWSLLLDKFVSNNREMLDSGNEVIPEAYIFVPTNLYRSSFPTGPVIAARSRPINESGRLGRYIIYKTPNGDINSDWMNEGDFQAMLSECKVELPAPDFVAAQTAKSAVEKVIAEEQLTHAMIVAMAPKPTALDIREFWWWRVTSWFVSYNDNGQVTGLRPLSLAVVFSLLGLGVFGWRWLGKRKQQT